MGSRRRSGRWLRQDGSGADRCEHIGYNAELVASGKDGIVLDECTAEAMCDAIKSFGQGSRASCFDEGGGARVGGVFLCRPLPRGAGRGFGQWAGRGPLDGALL